MTAIHTHAIAADTIFDGSAVHNDGAILIEGEHITWVGPRCALNSSVRVHILPRGCWIAPGFIDVQVNGGGDVLFNEALHFNDIARMVTAHRHFGTTSLLPTLISDTPAQMRAAWEAVLSFPRRAGVLGIHFEGPFLSPSKLGAHPPAMLRQPDATDLAFLTSPSELARLVTLAPEEVPRGFISALVAAGTRVALGHSMATYDQTRHAIEQGMTGFTHLFNAMRPLAAREPGPIAAALECQEAWFGMIVDGVHVNPAILRLALRGKAVPMLITDAMPPVGGIRKEFDLFGRKVTVHGGACMAETGTLAGTALNMASAVRNSVRLLQVSLATALRYASLEPARFLGLDHRLGRLAPGFYADMVAFRPEDISVLGTWVGGEWHSSTSASRILTGQTVIQS